MLFRSILACLCMQSRGHARRASRVSQQEPGANSCERQTNSQGILEVCCARETATGLGPGSVAAELGLGRLFGLRNLGHIRGLLNGLCKVVQNNNYWAKMDLGLRPQKHNTTK